MSPNKNTASIESIGRERSVVKPRISKADMAAAVVDSGRIQQSFKKTPRGIGR